MSLLKERVGTITVTHSTHGGYDLRFTPAVLPELQGEQTWIDPDAKTPKQAAHG